MNNYIPCLLKFFMYSYFRQNLLTSRTRRRVLVSLQEKNNSVNQCVFLRNLKKKSVAECTMLQICRMYLGEIICGKKIFAKLSLFHQENSKQEEDSEMASLRKRVCVYSFSKDVDLPKAVIISSRKLQINQGFGSGSAGSACFCPARIRIRIRINLRIRIRAKR